MRLVLLVPAHDDLEGSAAVRWAMQAAFDPMMVALGDDAIPELTVDDVLWCHAGSQTPHLSPAWRAFLQRWVAAGGHLFLSLLAAPLATVCGAPNDEPEVALPFLWHDAADPLWPPDFRDWPDFPHIRGAQGWGDHPLFDGLVRGAFTWRATEGDLTSSAMLRRTGHRRRPLAARVIAVNRAYVQLEADRAVAWEYDVGRGCILCLGANALLTAVDQSLGAQLDRYLVNAIAYLDPRRALHRSRRVWWPPIGHAVSPPLGHRPRPLHQRGPRVPPALELSGSARGGAPFTVAGRAALVVGDEQTGVKEVWIHPICVASDGVGTVVGGRALTALEVRVSPGSVERQLVDAGGGCWGETVTVSPDRPVVLYEWQPGSGVALADLTVTLQLRLRLQWPMPGDALQPLVTTLEQEGERASVIVAGVDPDVYAAVYIDGAASVSLSDSLAAPCLTARSVAGGALRLAVLATNEGAEALATEGRALGVEAMDDALARQRQRLQRRRAATVALQTPSPELDSAWEWAKARLASFVARVPGLGTGLMAGYATSRPGWSDSRPGYAWFFGRDACWCGDALLAAGLVDEARTALEFLARTSDASGKIVHEITTSGAAHYDAADATPLFLRFVAAYAEWTGDLATIRAHWAEVRAAVSCVLSHDRDHDGLPENSGVGHGWIESGALGGGALTSYTASIWIDALTRLAPVATWVGDEALATRLRDMHHQAAAAFEGRLRDHTTGRIFLHLDGEGRPMREVTALSAVPIALGVDRHAASDAVLDLLGSDRFSTPWGVRLMDREDARYDAAGYHVGAVWPLFTGWVALANFARRRPERGWRHLQANVASMFTGARGAFPEVLRGDDGRAAGVCPDQGWSAAMVISPFVSGLLGMRPFAPTHSCTIDPRWPAAWSSVTIEHLRVGRSVFSLSMHRGSTAESADGPPPYHYALQLSDGVPLDVRVGREPESATVRLELGRVVTVVQSAALPAHAPTREDDHGRS